MTRPSPEVVLMPEPDAATRMQECLFVGGPKDGCRLTTDVGLPCRFHEPVSSVDTIGSSYDLAFRTFTYRPVRFAGGLRMFVVYILDGMTTDQVMAALIARYPLPLPS